MTAINNWFIAPDTSEPWRAPELRKTRLVGVVYGHPELADGTFIRTSVIDKVEDGLVVTRSGTRYELMDPDPAYEAAFPNAKGRVLGQEN